MISGKSVMVAVRTVLVKEDDEDKLIMGIRKV
jgi:hypothetical protein